jgi:hypothetical protein
MTDLITLQQFHESEGAEDWRVPSWWTLADAAGNEADIATTVGRD